MHTIHINCVCVQAVYKRTKKKTKNFLREKSSRCYRPIVQTCVHQRAAYRLPLTCLPPPGHIVKYGSWRCTTPHLENYPQPPLALLAPFQRCLARHARRSLVRKEYCDLRICLTIFSHQYFLINFKFILRNAYQEIKIVKSNKSWK